MKVLRGTVSDRSFGVSGDNLAHVEHLISERMGLSSLVKGTLNIDLQESYFVASDAIISVEEYNDIEMIKLQRCVICGHRAVIMRPDMHERGSGHGLARIELMSEYHLRNTLSLSNGDPVEVQIGGDDAWWRAAK